MTIDQYKRHIELVEAVNNAKTDAAHCVRQTYLQGWREGVGCTGNDLMDADRHYMYDDDGNLLPGDRPICGGVWLDWEPTND